MLVLGPAGDPFRSSLTAEPNEVPFARRQVVLAWDDGASVRATEIRPGIAVNGEPSVAQARLAKLGFPTERERPALSPDEFVAEIAELVERLRRRPLGRRLVDFFGVAEPLPDPLPGEVEGTYGQDHPDHGINPRVLEARLASVPDRRVPIRLVVLQDESFADHVHTLVEPTARSAPAADGRGAFATMVFGPRNGFLVDRVAMAPEIGLAHQMVHAVHILSGSLDVGGGSGADAPVGTPERLARRMFLARTGRTHDSVYRWDDPANAAEWNALSAGQKTAVAELKKQYDELVALAGQVFQPFTPSAVKAGEVFFQSPVVTLEEARTHGNDVTTAWVSGVRQDVNPRRLGPSRRQNKSDSCAKANIKRIEDHIRKHPTDKKAVEALAGAQRTRQARLDARTLDETRIAAELGLPTRASYAPTLSKLDSGGVEVLWQRHVFLPRKRADLPDAAFRDPAPFTALVAALPPDSGAPDDPTPVADIRDYAQKLAAWVAADGRSRELGAGWRPGDHPLFDCTTRQRLRTVTVDPSQVPESVRQRASAVAQDALQHPATPVSGNGNERQRPRVPAPLPPKPPQRERRDR
ncbi:hypothetical protein [Streptoalloteichus hindustanus]|uniref:Uncharacterized protein n=1 Tax=Streptoalloteichus hindustanus TaxID=2017 RepID=A0A1M5M791_STRHI|nr:hypothetical protein [Streptoalloteichus hindustanus]SHG73127.1 hypothetical protein SAMN05444320_11316 [Streptoalloteichus hindustanus]